MKERSFLQRKYLELTGCLHVHSEYSYDSQTPVSRILEDAQRNKLDYLGLNDHLSDAARLDKTLLAENSIILIPGFEVNDPDNNNHLLVYGDEIVIKDKTAGEYVTEYHNRGAITFAAHPFERRATRKIRKYLWTDQTVNQFNGLEIWNALSNWVAKIRPNVNGLLWVLMAHSFIKRASRKSIIWWDEMNKQGLRKSAIGSVDAHGLVFHKLGLKIVILKHKFMFKTVRTNVLLRIGEEPTIKNILHALAEGRSYIVNYHRGVPYNFYAGIAVPGKAGVSFGEEIEFEEGMHFYFHLPSPARVKLFCDGSELSRQWLRKGSFTLYKKGNYRLEILKFNTGWIYTNNIYVI
ncbi:MAG: PHP domain-containing protein [Candidatus Cloacimonetes bacterium]|nr:PHP domain-containing protein [Candidatus Cloacimonadota bacterium]